MAANEAESMPKRARLETDFSLCVVCQKTVSQTCSQNPKPESLQKLLSFLSEYASHGHANLTQVHQRLSPLTIDTLLGNNAFYHKNCYCDIVNDRNLKRSIERYKKATIQQNASFVTPKSGRPCSETTTMSATTSSNLSETSQKQLRSISSPYDSNLCIICQKPGGWLHKVMTKEKGIKMLEVAQKHSEKTFFIRLNTLSDPSDAVANDVQYHQRCWIYIQRSVEKSEGELETREIDETSQVIADIEILSAIQCELLHPTGTALNMNNINTTYINLLQDNQHSNIRSNYKRYLKQLISESIPDIEFIKPKRQNESEKICSTKLKDDIVDSALDNISDDMDHLFRAAKLVRSDIDKSTPWQFTGSLNDYQAPDILKTIIKWIIAGPSTGLETENRCSHIDQAVDNITQIIVQSSKTNRQLNYTPKTNSTKSFYQTKETPFAVGLGLLVHKKTRSKEIVNTLAALNLCIDYEKVLRIETDIANSVIQRMSDNNGVYVPPSIQPDIPVYFAIDNCDFKNDTPDGKDEFHGTAQIVYQTMTATTSTCDNLSIVRDQSKSLKHDPFPPAATCVKPDPPNPRYPTFESDKVEVDIYRKWDHIWFLTKSLNTNSENVTPTWAAYNSMLTDALPITIYCGLPLYPGLPTDWSNLYEALRICQNITTTTSNQGKTIITLDLQLYAKAVQLRAKDNVNNNFVFRPGELHIVFAFLKAIGKYVECSGLDQMFIEAGIYGPASLDQILRGKHMKRAMEAYMTIYLALYILYIKQFLCKYPDIDDKLKSIVSVYLLNFENKSSANSTLRSTHDELINDLSEAELFTSLQEYDDSLTHQAQFLRNFMAMYEILLLFTRATRQGNWILHLSAIDLMIPYFFVHDLYNYARLMPEYLAQMHQLKEKDPDTWRFLEGNFSVNKSVAAFSAIGADHGIEQENRAMKVLGGVKGLLLNKAALYRFGIVAPELNRICDEFCLSNDVTNYGRTHHYQLSGSMNARVMSNITKLSDIFETYDVNFDNSQSVYNLVSKAVLSDKAETDLLNHRLIGEELYKTFVNERITGEISIWSKMKKRNLLTFKSAAKTVKTKLEGHMVELKEDRALMQRILVVSQKRPEVDLPKLIGQYEFSVTPRSLFSFDGKLLPCNDKSKLLHVIEDTANKSNTSSEDSMLITTQPLCSDSKVVIFDGMALVNQIVKTKEMKTCKDLSDVFVDKLIRKGEEFTEIRLVFDRYMEASLKEQTREKRTSGRAIRYIIKDSTSIVNITLKQLLSHIETKKDLTAYLAQNTLTALTEIGKRFVVTSDTECVSNIPEYPENLRRHNQEEADTLILLQAKNVSESNPYSELVVVSPDTDVFLLLIHFYPELCKITTFRTGTSATLRDIDIRKMYEWLGSSHAEALLSFHVFTGCDQTGRFFGKSKTECFKIFLDYDSNDLESLKMLGSNNLMPTDELIAGLEKFVLDIYCKRRPDTVNSIPLLRWHLFSKNQKSSEMLPPTSAALRFKILRSHYVTYILRNAMDPFPQRPDPVSFGWSLTGNMLMPTATDQLPAPTDMVELVMCGCKTNCATNRCKCKKHDLICTDMCQCHTCENVSGDTQELDDDLPSDFELEFSDNDDEDN